MTEINVTDRLGAVLAEATILRPRTFAGLTVFPLRATGRTEGQYDTLDRAIEAGTARVEEVSESGSVPQLKLVNDGSRPILLLDGEELIGAKQNRVLNLTILAPPRQTIVIPVSCTEQGRWRHVSRAFSSSDHVMHPTARYKKLASVTRSIKRAGHRMSDQGAVWGDVADLSLRYGARSDTGEMRAIYERHRNGLDDYVGAFETADDQVGAVFAVRDEIRGVELFDDNATLRSVWPKLIRSYGLDALDTGNAVHEVPTADDVRSFLDEVAGAELSAHDAAGLGTDLRVEGRQVVGGALVHGDRMVHLCAFRVEATETTDGQSGSGTGDRTGRPRPPRMLGAWLRSRSRRR